jgi:glucose-1-phosphate thymidylyltransferase
VFDKPLIYYPIATLMDAGIRDILIITTPHDQKDFQNLLGTGAQFGIKFSYAVQDKPGGLAEAFIVGENFINAEPVALILGDNIFSGFSLSDFGINRFTGGAHIFTYKVANPNAYGVINFNSDGTVQSIEEKPRDPKSNVAVTGLYFFDATVSIRAKKLQPSARGELEIVDLINTYLNSNELEVTNLPAESAWLDTGTPESLHDASSYVRVIEERTAIKIGCLEEIAFMKTWIDYNDLSLGVKNLGNNSYSQYLIKLLEKSK